jgi:hypothetical protein
MSKKEEKCKIGKVIFIYGMAWHVEVCNVR